MVSTAISSQFKMLKQKPNKIKVSEEILQLLTDRF